MSIADLSAAARRLSTAKPISYFTWTGTCQQEQASDATRAINLLYALTGCLDAPGGNFQLTKPATRHAEEALGKLDFFVQTELFHTPTTRWADIVLPVASCWEREGLQAGFMVSQAAESWVQLRPAVASPPGEPTAGAAPARAGATRRTGARRGRRGRRRRRQAHRHQYPHRDDARAARITSRLAPGTVWAQYGWWSESAPVSFNACCDGEAFDAISGSNALRGIVCRVERQF